MANLKLVDAFTDFVEESTLPYRQMMTYYNCALMEVETKFKVLNEQFSLFYDRNPAFSRKDLFCEKVTRLNDVPGSFPVVR